MVLGKRLGNLPLRTQGKASMDINKISGMILKLSGKTLGLLINFNVVHLKDGIKRMANGL